MSKQKEELNGLTCSEAVMPEGSYRLHICGKPAKGFLEDGRPACGIHLRMERKQEEEKIARNTRWEKREIFRSEIAAFCKEFHIDWMVVKDTEERTVWVSFDEIKTLLKGRGNK